MSQKPLTYYYPRNTPILLKWVIDYHSKEVSELLRAYYTKHFPETTPSFDSIQTIQFKHGLASPHIGSRKISAARSATVQESSTLYVPAEFIQKGILDILMLNHIVQDVYTRLSVREIGLPDGGKTYIVGVYAIRDIPAGINPFKTLLGDCFGENPVVYLDHNHPRIQETKSFLSEFFIGDSKRFALPILGPNSISVVYFMNHSDEPNMIMEAISECDYKIYKTKTAIKKGTELVIDYREFISKKDGLPFEALQSQLDPFQLYLSAPSSKTTKK